MAGDEPCLTPGSSKGKDRRESMKKFANLFVLVTLAACAVVFAVNAAAPAESSPAAAPAASGIQVVPGNYCQECHSAGDPRLLQAPAWDGGVAHNAAGPCPAVNTLREELYYTERLLLAVDRGLDRLPPAQTGSLEDRLAGVYDSYQRLLDEPVASLDAFQSSAQMLRYSLGKMFSEVNSRIQSNLEQRILIVALLVSLVILASLAWGYYNTQKLVAQRPVPAAPARLRPAPVLALVAIFALFALPIIRDTQAGETMATEEQQAIQAVLDTSNRAAEAAGRAQARVWMFGRVGAAWNDLDPTAGEQALQAALLSAENATGEAPALWGERQAAVEASAGRPAEMDDAALVTAGLAASASRAWGLRMAAEEWVEIDPARAAALFGLAVDTARGGLSLYRDLDLRAIAVSWARMDRQAGLDVVRMVKDPALRSWGLREVAALEQDPALFAEAAEAARKAAGPAQQARLLAEVAAAGGDPALFAEAQQVLGAASLEPEVLAFALAHLAVTARDPSLMACDSGLQAVVAACAAAYLELGDTAKARSYAEKLEDPYERDRALAALAAASGDAGLAQSIELRPLRERALRDAALALGDPDLVDGIQSPYLRVQAYTGLGEYAYAAEAALSLKEKYPLVDLILAQIESHPESALAAVEDLSEEADKAVVLRHLAHAQPTNVELFERALGMALAARVRGDAAAPVRASLELAAGLQTSNPAAAARAYRQALEAAQAISIQ